MLRFEEIQILLKYDAFKDDTLTMNEMKDNMMTICLCPTMFSLKANKFITEINGLLYKQNITLYTLIGELFLTFISLFEVLLDM